MASSAFAVLHSVASYLSVLVCHCSQTKFTDDYEWLCWALGQANQVAKEKV